MIYQQHFSEKEQINICQSGKSSFKKMFFQYFQEELEGEYQKYFDYQSYMLFCWVLRKNSVLFNREV